MKYGSMALLIMLALLVSAVCFAAEADNARPLKIVCFGDSITGHRPHEPYQDKYLKYADLLQLVLEARLGAGKTVVLNRGFAGDKTYKDPGPQTPGAIERLQQDVLDEQPDIVTILIGGNDKKDTPEQRELTRKNLDAMVSRCTAAGIKVLLLQYHVLPNPASPEKTWYHLAKNNDLIAEVGAAHQAPVLDMNAPMQEAATRYPHDELANAVDGVHLGPRGEIIYARTIYGKLLELGWVK